MKSVALVAVLATVLGGQAIAASRPAQTSKDTAKAKRRGSPQLDIALGLNRFARDSIEGAGMLKAFAHATNGVHWQDWQDRGLVPQGVKKYIEFPKYFELGAKRARRIFFNLDRVDLAEARRDGPRGFAGDGSYTNAELWLISQKPRLLRKTIFFRGKKTVPAPFSEPAWTAAAP